LITLTGAAIIVSVGSLLYNSLTLFPSLWNKREILPWAVALPLEVLLLLITAFHSVGVVVVSKMKLT
jgi:hypothetical protein